MSGYWDSNPGPPTPEAGALTGLRYIPKYLTTLPTTTKLHFQLQQNYTSNYNKGRIATAL